MLLTRSCILLLYIPLLASPVLAQSADALYADRENIASAKRAAELWAAESTVAVTSYEPAWKLARVCYWLGTHAPAPQQRGYLDQGIVGAQRAVQLEPGRPEGHFWAAANMGALAENFGLRLGMKYRKPIRDELETVLRLDPAFMEGSADRALGRYYFKVPALLGGSRARAEQHLRASLRYDAESTISHFFLAELLIDEKRLPEAKAELQRVIDAPLSAQWAPEDRGYKSRASARLAELH
jgi:hypothetical protein